MKGDLLRGGPVRWLVWGGAAFLLLLPLVAMQFDTGVHWDGFDFLVMGAMLLALGVSCEVAARIARSNACMLAAGLAAGGAFLTTWSNLAVGIIGNEDNPANQLFFWVIGVELAGALAVRFRAGGMVWVMVATALAQLAVCLYAWLAGLGYVFVFTAVMCALWLASARLFLRAERLQSRPA